MQRLSVLFSMHFNRDCTTVSQGAKLAGPVAARYASEVRSCRGGVLELVAIRT